MNITKENTGDLTATIKIEVIPSDYETQVGEALKEVQKKANLIEDDRHIVLNTDGLVYAYETQREFDFIFIDCYDAIDEESLPMIEDMAFACRRILKDDGRIVGWWDESTPEDFVNNFFDLFK